VQIKEEDYLQVSAIQHYAFCSRQWALIYLEDIWKDNWRTIDGAYMHERAHDSKIKEKREDLVYLHALKIVSHRLGISGETDVVGFIRDKDGINLNGYEGKYRPFPIEYKRGKLKYIEPDSLQLCAEAICLEEMLLVDIPRGAIFYGEIHRRIDIEFTNELRNKVEETVKQMHIANRLQHTPKPNLKSYCKECSLINECVPLMVKRKKVQEYIQEYKEEKE